MPSPKQELVLTLLLFDIDGRFILFPYWSVTFRRGDWETYPTYQTKGNESRHGNKTENTINCTIPLHPENRHGTRNGIPTHAPPNAHILVSVWVLMVDCWTWVRRTEMYHVMFLQSPRSPRKVSPSRHWSRRGNRTKYNPGRRRRRK